jgi:hypothetical protein
MKKFNEFTEAYVGQAINSSDKKTIKVTGPDGKPYFKQVAAKRNLTQEETELKEKGLWDNIHAKRERIKAGSGERMRKPGSKGAPTNQNFKDASVNEEAEYDEDTEMTRTELKIAINSAKEILDMMDDGVEIERWQVSEIVTASDSLSTVYQNLCADNDYEEDDE